MNSPMNSAAFGRGIERALILIVTGLLAACVSTGRQMPKPQPEKASDINLELGYDYFRKGKLSEAKEKIDRAMEQNPRSAAAQSAAGLLYDRLGEPKVAEKHFDKALSLEPKNADIQNSFAAFLCGHERYEEGEKYALQAAKSPLYKTPEYSYLNAGNCVSNAGNVARAEEHYRAALKVNPRFGEALYKMADLEFRKNNYMSARGFLSRYLELGRTSASTLWLALRIEQGLGNAAAAKSYAQRLKSEYPRASETRQLLETERNSG